MARTPRAAPERTAFRGHRGNRAGKGVIEAMETAAAQAPGFGSVTEAAGMLESAMRYLAGADFPELAEAEMAQALKSLERADAVEAVVRGKLVKMFDLVNGQAADGHQSVCGWLKWETGITGTQAKAHKYWAAQVDEHRPIIEAMTAGRHMPASLAARCCGWTRKLPLEFRAKADQILVDAFLAGADEQGLAQIAAELIAQLTPPDQDDGKLADRGLRLEDTIDGAGILRGEGHGRAARGPGRPVRQVREGRQADRGRADARCAARGDEPAAGRA